MVFHKLVLSNNDIIATGSQLKKHTHIQDLDFLYVKGLNNNYYNWKLTKKNTQDLDFPYVKNNNFFISHFFLPKD